MPALDDLNHKFAERHDGKCLWCGQNPDTDLHTTPPLIAVVVLAFTDWKEAVKFATPGQTPPPVNSHNLHPDYSEERNLPRSATVAGLFRLPTAFCSCGYLEGSGEKNKVMGYTKGKRFGWWVHHICGKPAVAWSKGFGVRLASVFGYNMMKNAPYPFNNPHIAHKMDQDVGRKHTVMVPTRHKGDHL